MKIILSEQEKNRILGLHRKAILEQAAAPTTAATAPTTAATTPTTAATNTTQAQIVQGSGKDPYQYKKENGKYFYAKKSEGQAAKWILVTKTPIINKIKTIVFKEAKPLNLKSLVGKTVLDHSGEKNGVILSVTKKKTNCPDKKPVYEIKIRNLNGPSLFYYYFGGGEYWFASSGGFEDNDIIVCDLGAFQGFNKFKSTNLQQLFGF
jgi:hypothetical protein